MTVSSALLVLVGGAVGAVLRHLTNQALGARAGAGPPSATLVVNVIGSAVLGATSALVVGLDGPQWVLTLVGTGFCGALTTFSTFSHQTFRLIEQGAVVLAARNVSAQLVLGLAACAGGWWVGAAMLS